MIYLYLYIFQFTETVFWLLRMVNNSASYLTTLYLLSIPFNGHISGSLEKQLQNKINGLELWTHLQYRNKICGRIDVKETKYHQQPNALPIKGT